MSDSGDRWIGFGIGWLLIMIFLAGIGAKSCITDGYNNCKKIKETIFIEKVNSKHTSTTYVHYKCNAQNIKINYMKEQAKSKI